MSFISKFTKRDLGFSVLTGGIAGTIAWQIFTYLKVPEVRGMPWMALIVVIPILWMLGVLLGYFLGQWIGFFDQFGKFAAIGFTNFAVSAGVLNVLLAYTGYAKGIGYSVINSISFIVAVLSSFMWNKYWAFSASGGKAQKSGGVEFAKFFGVTLVAFGVNLIVSSIVVNVIHPAFGLDAHQWANIGTVVGSAVGLVFSFVGFKLAVFKK